MSYEETIRKMNAAINTTDAWERRWQIEREANERLLKCAQIVRSTALQLRDGALQKYKQLKAKNITALDAGHTRDSDILERLCGRQSGAVEMADQVLRALDEASREG
jgi:hypothetical protein